MSLTLTLLAFILIVMWSIGGAIGGAATAISLWSQRASATKLALIFWGWVKAFTLGGLAYLIGLYIFAAIMDSLMTGPYSWGWDVIPPFLALFGTGAVIGWAGGNHMLVDVKYANNAEGDQ